MRDAPGIIDRDLNDIDHITKLVMVDFLIFDQTGHKNIQVQFDGGQPVTNAVMNVACEAAAFASMCCKYVGIRCFQRGFRIQVVLHQDNYY